MTRPTRPVSWISAARKAFEEFPEGAQSICLAAFTIAAEGGKADVAKPMHGLGSGIFEIALTIEGDAEMKAERFEVTRGSGNVYRDLRNANADVKQLKALLAAEILKALDRERLSVRQAQVRTGIAAADFSRIRNADLGRFTLDRLMSIINRLGSRVEVKVKVRPPGRPAHAVTA